MIELMIVMAVIGVLAAVAMPMYQVYVARAQFAEALQLLASEKNEVAARFEETGSCVHNPRLGGARDMVTGLLDTEVSGASGRYVQPIRVSETARGHRWVNPDRPQQPGWEYSRGSYAVYERGFCRIETTFKQDGVAKVLQSKKIELETNGDWEKYADTSRTLGRVWVCKTNVDARYRVAECEGM
nr:pilin [Ralstonia sp. 25mfcol4.1]